MTATLPPNKRGGEEPCTRRSLSVRVMLGAPFLPFSVGPGLSRPARSATEQGLDWVLGGCVSADGRCSGSAWERSF